MIWVKYRNDLKAEIERTISEDPTLEKRESIPDSVPLMGQRWIQIDDVTAVYGDMVDSSKIDFESDPKTSASIYEVFTGSLVDTLWAFGSEYIDVQGDGVLAIFTGSGNVGRGLLAATSFLTACESTIRPAVKKLTSSRVEVCCRVGLGNGPTIVKRIGRRSGINKEVWAYRTVNETVKLCKVASPNSLVVSQRAFSKIAACDSIIYSCGCEVDRNDRQKVVGCGEKKKLWEQVPRDRLQVSGISDAWELKSTWCPKHGDSTFDRIAEHYALSFPRIESVT